jgi:hypothetical protein
MQLRKTGGKVQGKLTRILDPPSHYVRTTFFMSGLSSTLEDGGSRFLQNTNNDVSDYIMSSQKTIICMVTAVRTSKLFLGS